MPLSHLDEFFLHVLTGLVMAILLAVIGLWAWAIPKLLRGDPLLSPIPILPLRSAQWGGRTVFAVILLYFAANIAAGVGYGAVRGFRRPAPTPKQGAETVASKESRPVDQQPDRTTEGQGKEKTDSSSAQSPLTSMLLNSGASLLFVIALPTVFRRSAGVAIPELGFSRRDWPRQVLVGAVAALLTAPAVYAVQSLAVQIWKVREHPVQQMMADQLSPDVAILALISTVFLAPLVEESLFRGILLNWLSRVFTPSPPDPEPRASAAESHLDDDPGPGLNTMASEPDLATDVEPVPTRPNAICFPAVVATSLLFAGMHAPQWPAPVGIFFLSMVLGVVYQRTGSLLTAMVMHSVFNGCSTLLLLQGLLAQSIQDGKPATPVIAPNLEPAMRALIDGWSWFF